MTSCTRAPQAPHRQRIHTQHHPGARVCFAAGQLRSQWPGPPRVAVHPHPSRVRRGRWARAAPRAVGARCCRAGGAHGRLRLRQDVLGRHRHPQRVPRARGPVHRHQLAPTEVDMLQVAVTERLRAAATRALAAPSLPRLLRNELASYAAAPADGEAAGGAVPVAVVQQLSAFLVSQGDAGAALSCPWRAPRPQPHDRGGGGGDTQQRRVCTSCCRAHGSSLKRPRPASRCAGCSRAPRAPYLC
jgi:hypothetical protein